MEEVKKEEVVKELTAGQMLRNARTTGRRKREIPTVAKQLCIREEFLQALEDGDYAVIGELVYVLGFARNYAMELGLNPDEVVAKIKQELHVASDCQTSSDMDSDGGSCAIAGKKFKGVLKAIGGSLRRAWGFVVRHWKWFVGAIAALVVISLVALFVMSGDDNTAAMAQDAEATAQIANEPKYGLPVRERWGAKMSDEADVVLQATRDSWIKIEDARGRTEFSRVLVKGDIYRVSNNGKFKATFGDAGGIDVWVKGKQIAKVGADHVRKSDISLSVTDLTAAPKKAEVKEAKSETESKTAD